MEEKVEIEVGSTYNLKVTIQPTNTIETATYSSENESIATISNSGKIEAKKIGTTKNFNRQSQIFNKGSN